MTGDYYRVVASDPGCPHCHNGQYWTVVYVDTDGQTVAIGTDWADQETAEDVCDLMNMAYEAGTEKLNHP